MFLDLLRLLTETVTGARMHATVYLRPEMPPGLSGFHEAVRKRLIAAP